MTSFDDLLSQVPIGQIASKLGVDEATARDVVNKALPVLLGGLQAKTSNSEQEQSLQGLVDQHQDEGLLAGGVDIDQVDVHAGEQIVDDVFGSNKNTVINALGATGAGGNDLMAKVLPILAPIVLAYLSKQVLGKDGAPAGSAGAGQADAGGPLAEILGGLLGGAAKNGGLGGALSDALGKNAGSVLGNVLGGLLGGKR
ncbi:DUF937 domain-containing protein [Nocardia sp. CDC159]|uniref:DUF937 domain-containing protein n=1 Tax=Nocardia pulmonis TaxID=2951408 RepID=A0A9X2E2M7_9NOCA|nr:MULTISPECIES: DUF937 domain-containing protein [Nocardia]MCM6772997.1 DUF937 domain-containing protein [Nocardia pulmonis]MCM6785700.1 DUF937 domain-containing protein [Nocardia sp. CDC159]